MTEIIEVPAPIEVAAPPPCVAHPRNRAKRCGKPATHVVVLCCQPCGYSEPRNLCAKHAIAAGRAWWWCKLCGTRITHFILER